MMSRLIFLILFLSAVLAHAQPGPPPGGGGGSGDITEVGDCTTAACFEGTDGTTLTGATASNLILDSDLEVELQTDGATKVTVRNDGDLTLENDAELSFRNAADSADVDVLSLNAIDTTLLQCVDGGSIFFLEEDGTQMFSAQVSGNESFFRIEANSGGIYADTSDGGDSKTVYLSGGGDNAENRGATIWAYGNEGGFEGLLFLAAGDDAALGEIWFRTDSTTQWAVEYDGDLVNQADNNVEVQPEVYGVAWNGSNEVPTKDALYDKIETIGGGGAAFPLDNDVYATWRNAADSADVDVLKLDATDNPFFHANSGKVYNFEVASAVEWTLDALRLEYSGGTKIDADTSDASDNAFLQISAGGDTDEDRGATIKLEGNESGDPGEMILSAGNVTGGEITFRVAGANQWHIREDGNLRNLGDNDVITSFDVYSVSWDGNGEVPTKNDVYDKIETLGGGGVISGGALGVDYYDHTFTWPSGTTTGAVLSTQSIAHSVGRPPDLVQVYIQGANGWYAHYDRIENTTGIDFGWDTMDTGVDENNTTVVRLFTSDESGAARSALVRLLWLTDDSITASPSTGLKVSPTKISVDNNLLLDAGTSISIDQGTPADACAGTSTLNGTTAVTISTTCVDTGALIFLTRTSLPTVGGSMIATNIVDGVSFDIDSDNASDDSTVNWLIINDS